MVGHELTRGRGERSVGKRSLEPGGATRQVRAAGGSSVARRIEHLDALRGVAAMAVFAEHLLYPLTRSPATPPLVRAIVSGAVVEWFNPGRFGVVLFFLLSGYVIPLSFRGERPVADFVIGRLFRLYPAYWLSLAIAVAVMPALAGATITPAQLLANLTMVQRLFGQDHVLGVYWSLFIELLFYACCIALFATRRLVASVPLAGATIACALASIVPLGANAMLDAQVPVQFVTYHLAFLFLGGVIRNAVAERQPRAMVPLAAAMIVVLASIPFATGLVVPVDPVAAPPAERVGMAIGNLAALALFIAACRTAPPVTRELVWLGGVSYAVYILHVPMLKIAEAISPLRSGPAALLYATIATILTLGAAWLCYTCVEKPAIAIGRRLRARR